MTHGFRNAMVLATAAAWLSVAAWAQQPTQGQPHDHDTHQRDMLTRGAQAMGFDQERTVHHFTLHEDGGAIDVAVKEAGDQENLHAVRQHLQDIAALFTAGDFGKPALTHAQQVPGTAEMTRLRDRIVYQYEETRAGGRVRIVTRDAAALAAVHAFLRYQIEDHRTGDSVEVQPPTSGRTMNGMGQAMMRDRHDAATMAQMGDIHQLFVNHDRITRTVTNLPNGIRTVTESADPRVAQLLKDHVSDMGRRVETGDDPGLPIESPALRTIFRNYDKIQTTIEATATGVVVIQTSTDRDTVTALRQHAAEVTDFVTGGMAAMHAAMMRNRGGMMHGGMHGGMMHGSMLEPGANTQTTPAPR